jgi:hypothetical protein
MISEGRADVKNPEIRSNLDVVTLADRQDE